MAKHIKITQDNLEDVRLAFFKALASFKSSDGKFSFSHQIGTVSRRATVYFTELAWLKMTSLVRECDKEVGWHGVATRGEDESKDEYLIHDILVYPQEVTGSTVTPNQQEYQTWLFSHDDDVFHNIRMQGHSHVYMGVTPSMTDTEFYEGILSQLNDTMFYIFMIWNKRGEKTIKIYDLKKNILFETADCDVKVLPGVLGLEQFLSDAKKMVREKAYTPVTPTYYRDGYRASYAGNSNTTAPVPMTKKEEKPASNVRALPDTTKKKQEKKGKRKGKRKPAAVRKPSFPPDDSGYPYYDDTPES